MNRPAISELLIPVEATIRTALQVVDQGAQGVAFAVDDGGRVVGVLTDGDLRRAILAGATLDSPVRAAMNTRFVSRPIDTPNETVNALLNERIRHMPLVDSAGRPLDYASLHRLRQIPVLEPAFGGNELAYLSECVRTGWVSSKGRFIGEFEKKLREFTGAQEAIAVSNGTVALHLALAAMGIGPGDEVIVPDLTFGACANAILQAGATPVFADVDPRTWCLSAETVRPALSNKTRAIMAVHLYGHPCDMDPLTALCRDRGLLLLEDCAEALGATYKGRHVGSFGDAATFSFFGNKTVTTGEGGMVLFREAGVAARARILRDHGMSPAKRYWHDEPGFNYRMTNLQAAIGVAQMERADALIAAKRAVAGTYFRRLSGHAPVGLPPSEAWAVNSHWLFTVLLPEGGFPVRDEVIARMQAGGIETRPAFYPLSTMPAYSRSSRSVPTPHSKNISARGVSLPSSATLTAEEVEQVCLSLESAIRALGLAEAPSGR